MADEILIEHGETLIASETSEQLFPENTGRDSVLLQNNSNSDFRLIFGPDGAGTPPTINHGILFRARSHVPIRGMDGAVKVDKNDPTFMGPVYAFNTGRAPARLDWVEVTIVPVP